MGGLGTHARMQNRNKCSASRPLVITMLNNERTWISMNGQANGNISIPFDMQTLPQFALVIAVATYVPNR